MPKGITMKWQGDVLIIVRRWFSWMNLCLLLVYVPIFWLVFREIVALYMESGRFPILSILVTVLGILFAYYIICHLFNFTKITVDSHYMSITHRPFPWPGSGTWAVCEIDQLFCKEHTRNASNVSSVTYELLGIIRDKQTRLIRGIDDKEQAQFLESELEKAMGIEDKAIAGECT